MPVYIMEAENGLVKIGRSNDPHERTASFITASPLPVRLVAILPERDWKEMSLHRRFYEKRKHSEWFNCDGELKKFVEDHYGAGMASPVQPWGN